MDQPFVCALCDVPAGRSVKVKSLTAKGPMRSRLYALGFTPGTIVEVCPESCGAGCRRVRVRECSLVLDQGLAEYIECIADAAALAEKGLPGAVRPCGLEKTCFPGACHATGTHS